MKNWKLLSLPTALLTVAAFVAGACTFEEGTIDGLGGFGGSDETGGSNGTGGKGTGGGSATGGAGGQGGMVATLDCAESGEPEGTLGEPPTDVGACQACLGDADFGLCVPEYVACAASSPDTACFYGSTMYDTAITGEFDCMLACLQSEAEVNALYTAGPDDIDYCAGECGSSECNPSSAGSLAIDLATCMLGNSEGNCQSDCAVEPVM